MKLFNKKTKNLLAGMAAGLASVLYSTGAFAQTTITVGTGQTYTTLAAAITYINGLTNVNTPAGGFIINVPAGHTENTTSGISIDKVYTNKPLQIKKSGTGNNPVITYTGSNSTTTDFIIKLNGVATVTIDGIDVTGNTSVEYGFHLLASTGSNTIKNSKITMDRTNTTSVGIYSNASGSNRNSSNLFEYLTIENAYTGISLNGISSGKEDLNSIIRYCTIGGSAMNDIGNGANAVSGVLLTYQSGITVTSNTIRNVTATSTNQVAGLNIGTGVTLSTFANNIIYGINGNTSGTTPTAGIYVNGTSGNKLYFNSISLTGVRLNSASNATAISAALHVAAGTSLDIRNNIFSNTQTNSGTGTANTYAIYSAVATSSFTTIDNNDYYVNTTEGVTGYIGGSSLSTLTQWQSATSKDANSLFADPFFASTTDLQTSNCLLKEKAATGTGITTDAYSNTRSSSPSIGAYDMPNMVRSGTWVGATSNAWGTTSNWCDNALPTTSVDVNIESKYTNQPTVTSGTANARNITIGTGASLTVNGGTLNYTGTLTNNGTFTYTSGDLKLSGSNQVVPFTTVNNLTITSPTTTISSDLTVNGTLTLLSGGILNTGANKVILSSTGSLSENATSYVLGVVEATRTVVANTNETFGNIGYSMNATGSILPGLTTILRTNGGGGVGTYGSNSGIKRNYAISAANDTGLNVTVVFSYLNAELNGLDESTLQLFRSADGGQHWEVVNSTLDTTNNTMTASGVKGFSIWTGGSSVTPLPVNLVSFNAVRKNENTVELNWKTAGELNNDRFEIERSADGINFTTIGTEAGNGTTDYTINYSFEDNTAPKFATVLYYRLKQVDYNGAFEYSPITRLANGSINTLTPDIKAWYNSTEGNIRLTTLNTESELVNINIIDMQGRVVATQATKLTKGTNNISLDIQHLNNGIYSYLISSDKGMYTGKIIKY